MTDPFRISAGDGKIPDLSIQKEYEYVIAQIQLMDPSTAYVAVQGIVVPTLNRLQKYHSAAEMSSLQSPAALLSAPQTVKIEATSFLEFTKGIDKIRKNLKDIQNRINDLKKNYEKIMSLLVDKDDENSSQITDPKNGLWTLDDTRMRPGDKNDWRRHGGLFGEFFAARDFIEDKLKEINQTIAEIEKYPIDNSLIGQLKQIAENISKNIPDPSDKWNKKEWTYNGKIWVHKYLDGGNWRVRWDQDEGADKNAIKNPLGLLEMTQDPKKFGDYLSNITNGLKKIDVFVSSAHTLKLKYLDTESAYMYIITVLLPFLQNESAKALEEQGETMKQISKAFDKWNEMQEEINILTKTIEEIKKKGLINESGELEITNIIDYKDDKGDNYKVVWIKDPDQSFKPLMDAKEALNAKISDMQALLKDLEGKLPPSQQSLIATMKELTSQLVLKGEKEYRFYYHPDSTSSLRFEIREDLVNLPNNKDFDFMRTFISSAMRNEYLFIADPDQTQFKAYMDNIAQGITALTSISNMTQQELQIATQYYDSLLGLQKNAFDSLNKVIQVATRNPNY